MFLLFAALFSLPEIIFLVVSASRFSLVNNFSGTIGFPRNFYKNLLSISYEKRGYWVNRLFGALLSFGAVVGLMMFTLTFEIYEGTLSNGVLSPYVVIGVVLVILISAVGLILYLRRYSREMTTDAS